jgi:hypothetical protein
MTSSRMKKFFQYLILIILISFSGIILTNKESFREDFQQIKRTYIDKPCAKPIKYSVGTIDLGFSISESDFKNTINQAEEIWDDPMGRKLFQYDPNAEFKINLIYDERQQATQESKSMENQLNNLQATHDQLAKEYDSASAASKKKIDDYNKAVADYKEQLDKYNKEVAYWNSQGGAPADEFDKLKKEKKDLDSAYNDLEKRRKSINALISDANALAQKSNQVAQNYNSNLNTYKNKFGESREFDKGIYDGSSINIYQFNDQSDLRLALAHEMGHALGIDHLSQPESIMYYMMGEQDLDNPKVSDEDLNALKQICKLK